jgi:hypothetical protein
MEPLALTLILSEQDRSLAHSALPGAPVVAPAEPRSAAVRTRSAAATALRRLADVVAPPAHTLCESGR